MRFRDGHERVKWDAWYYTVSTVLWVPLLIISLVDTSGLAKSFKMMGMILVPIALLNAVKSWMMVYHGWV